MSTWGVNLLYSEMLCLLAAIAAALVRRPSRSSPEWQPLALKSAADVRDFTALLKKKLAEWSDNDD